MKQYVVKMDKDAVGFYVVEMLGNIEMFIKGTSYSKKEMIELADSLNKKEMNLTKEKIKSVENDIQQMYNLLEQMMVAEAEHGALEFKDVFGFKILLSQSLGRINDFINAIHIGIDPDVKTLEQKILDTSIN